MEVADVKEFKSLGQLAAHLMVAAERQHLAERKALSKAAAVVEKHAKAKIGTYQEQAGPFMAWQPLADATKEDRLKQGFTEDDPLWRTGDLRDSIATAMSTDGHEAQVGSNSDVAVYQELGTKHMAPRSFLGGALADKLTEVREIVAGEVVAALVGEHVFNKRMEVE